MVKINHYNLRKIGILYFTMKTWVQLQSSKISPQNISRMRTTSYIWLTVFSTRLNALYLNSKNTRNYSMSLRGICSRMNCLPTRTGRSRTLVSEPWFISFQSLLLRLISNLSPMPPWKRKWASAILVIIL